MTDAPKFPGDEGDPFDEEAGSGSGMGEDLQEALSIQYASQCRVAVLASGRWAIWLGGGPPIICDNFEPEQMKKLIAGAQQADDLARAERRRGVVNQVVDGDLEELGL